MKESDAIKPPHPSLSLEDGGEGGFFGRTFVTFAYVNYREVYNDSEV
jgi:hypothetical protein